MTNGGLILLFLATLSSQDPAEEVIRLNRAGQYQEARKVIQRLIDGPANFNGAYRVSLWLWLGTIENTLSHYQKAQEALETGLRIAEENELAAAEVRVSLLAALGEAHTSQGHFRDADRVLREARDLAERQLPAGHVRLASVYDGFAALHLARGQVSRAEASIRQALSILERHYGADHPIVAVQANALASLLIRMGRPALAIPIVEHSRRVLLDAYGPRHPDTILATYNMAAARIPSAPAAAEELLRAELAVWLESQPEQHTITVAFLMALAKTRSLQRDYAGAIGYSARALKLSRELWGPEHPQVVAEMESQAGLLKAAKRGKEAAALKKEANQIRERQGYPEPGQHTIDIQTLRPH